MGITEKKSIKRTGPIGVGEDFVLVAFQEAAWAEALL
jgi:hypothetical protein